MNNFTPRVDNKKENSDCSRQETAQMNNMFDVLKGLLIYTHLGKMTKDFKDLFSQEQEEELLKSQDEGRDFRISPSKSQGEGL